MGLDDERWEKHTEGDWKALMEAAGLYGLIAHMGGVLGARWELVGDVEHVRRQNCIVIAYMIYDAIYCQNGSQKPLGEPHDL